MARRGLSAPGELRPARRMTSALVRALRYQQAGCAHLGSAFYADMLEQVIDDVDQDGPCAEAMRGPWAGDLTDLAVPLRFLAALNRLVLDRSEPALDPWWPPLGAPVDASIRPVLGHAVDDHMDRIKGEMSKAVQTNEVGRSAALAGGFLTVASLTGLPLRLLEIGSSAGLNLRWDHYHYTDRGVSWGPTDSPLHLDGPFDGAPSPLTGDVVVAQRHGCDLHPLDPLDPADRLWLRSFVWPDQAERLHRLDAAIAVASQVPATVTAANASSWLPDELTPQVEGVATVVFHSIVWQYLPRNVREKINATMGDAARRATDQAPLAWLRYEPTRTNAGHATLELTTWPPGRHRTLAHAGFHGAPVTWLRT